MIAWNSHDDKIATTATANDCDFVEAVKQS
jgi:hypothetical protein